MLPGRVRMFSQNLLKSCVAVAFASRSFSSAGEVFVGRVHVGELRGAERLAVATRHLDRVEHVREADGRVVGHVGVPVLARVGETDRLAVLDDVREIADLRHAGHVDLPVTILACGRSAERSPAARRIELLTGKVKHAVTAEGLQNRREVRVAQGFREIEPRDGRPQDLPARLDGRHRPRAPHASPPHRVVGIILRRVRLRGCTRRGPAPGFGLVGRVATKKRRPQWRSRPRYFAKCTNR